MIDFGSLIENFLKRERRAKTIGRYYPSEIGSCLRKVWFSYKIPKDIDEDTTKIFHMGNMLHDFIADVLRSEKNPGVRLLESEKPFTIDTGDFVVSGRVDDIVLVELSGEKFLVEVKSTRMLPTGASGHHRKQLQLYMHALKIPKGIILYVEKHSLKTREFLLDYDPSEIEGIMKRFSTLHECLKKDVCPGPEARLSKDMGWMCRYCDYRDECIKRDAEKDV